jgi:hypothetical protein
MNYLERKAKVDRFLENSKVSLVSLVIEHQDIIEDILKLSKYLDNFMASDYYLVYKLPLIAFSSDDCEILEDLLARKGLRGARSVHKIYSACKHFPYTCVEFNPVKTTHGCCFCSSKLGSTRETHKWPQWLAYLPYEWENAHWEHIENCYDDCCCIVKISNRFTIEISNE